MTTGALCQTCGPRLHEVLGCLVTPRGLSAAGWLWSPVSGDEGHVLLGGEVVVVHTDARRPGIAAHARAGALPVPTRSVAAVVVPPILPRLPELDGLFSEIRRVLRPHGLLSMAVSDGPPLGLRARRLRADVRAHWDHRSAVDHPDWLLTAADFAVMGDDRLVFRHPDVGDPGAFVDTLSAAGLLPPRLPDETRARLAAHPAVQEGRVSVRRLVARR